MKLLAERTAGVAAGDGDGDVLMVAVKFDAQSRELLTWSLMKMAQPGDRVIALHVLDSITDGTASLLSLVKTFDSLLSVYEGFCNLKQVDLKLKVCRGSSVKKVLVREAHASAAAKVIVGTSKGVHIYASTSIAKYCARKLSKRFSVLAVRSGKIVFQREATRTIIRRLQEKSNEESQICSRQSEDRNSVNGAASLGLDNSGELLLDKSYKDVHVDNSLALIPVQMNEVVPTTNSTVVEGFPKSKKRWSFLRRIILLKQRHTEKSDVQNTSVVKWVLKLPSSNTSSVIYPDKKQSISYVSEDNCCNLEAESGAIVTVSPGVSWFPISPYNGSDGLPEELKGLHEKYSSSCRLFSYEELLLATSNFHPANMVGKGGSSYVFKGCLPDGKELAVKILKPSEHVLKEFVTEIDIIDTLHHKNIISLSGFCFESNCLLLVFDFLSRGSLEENLHGHKKNENAFGWQERYKVAVGVAEALDYLHNECDQPVIHGDVKSSNILLSKDFEPQLSDFGLACLVSTSARITCTDVTGTFGYLAPEYFTHGKVSDKVDVFAFGVVLLELLSGRMPINSENPKGQESLVMWARPILEGGEVSQLLDPHVRHENDNDQIERIVLAAALCVRHCPLFRPQTSLILKLLQGDREIMNWARQQVSTMEEVNVVDGDPCPSNIQSHLNLALLDLEDDSLSISSSEQGISLEDYLKGRWSRTSSFD